MRVKVPHMSAPVAFQHRRLDHITESIASTEPHIDGVDRRSDMIVHADMGWIVPLAAGVAALYLIVRRRLRRRKTRLIEQACINPPPHLRTAVEGVKDTLFGSGTHIPDKFSEHAISAIRAMITQAPKRVRPRTPELLWMAKLISVRHFADTVEVEHLTEAARLVCGVEVNTAGPPQRTIAISEDESQLINPWRGKDVSAEIARSVRAIASVQLKVGRRSRYLMGEDGFATAMWIYASHTINRSSLVDRQYIGKSLASADRELSRMYVTGKHEFVGDSSAVPNHLLYPGRLVHDRKLFLIDTVLDHIDTNAIAGFSRKRSLVSRVLDRWVTEPEAKDAKRISTDWMIPVLDKLTAEIKHLERLFANG